MPSAPLETAQRTGPTFSSSTKIDGVVAAGRLGDGDRRADCRVPGEGQFVHRREDAHIGAVRLVLGRQDEHRLGQVELAGDRLHRVVVEPVRLEHHRQRIAGKSFAGKHVIDGKLALALRHASSPVQVATGNMAEI